jgi:hypothetical protein
MKKFISIIIRFILGLLLAAALVSGLFALVLRVIPTWGASAEEVAHPLPGDDLTVNRTLFWTNAMTINSPPEKVWPWIAQIGDSRGGFYSYTFIENQVGALTGAKGYNVVYVNANEIHPEWQNPQPGDPFIQGSLKIRQVETGKYLLADSVTPSPFTWVWIWHLDPMDSGAKTRMVVRFAIEVPDTSGDNPVMGFMLNVGGFVMQQNMMQGIKLRVEGRTEPAWIEPVEIGLWMIALLSGLAAGGLYLFKKKWDRPLVAAVLSILVLFILTFVQPPILIRCLLDIVLIAGVVSSAKRHPSD